MLENWESVLEHNVDDKVPLKLYRSKNSRLQVVIADVPGPVVNGVFSFVTPVWNNDGVSYALSKLIFKGSQKYPYANALEETAHLTFLKDFNVHLASMNSKYSYTTVGSDGFMKALPVQMDSLLCPLLTEEAFLTEVHHINKKGDDKGLVYEEAQQREYRMNTMVQRTYREIVYTNVNEPYRHDPSGTLEDIRTSCTIDKIRTFHELYYHVNNLMIVVCGLVNHENLLHTISAIEKPLIAQAPAIYKIPPPCLEPSITNDVVKTIECPSKDEVSGIVMLTWNLPSVTDSFKYFGVKFLCIFMQELLKQEFQHDDIEVDFHDCGSNEICFMLAGSPIDKLVSAQEWFTKNSDEFFRKEGAAFKPELFKLAIRSMISEIESKYIDYIPNHFTKYAQEIANVDELKSSLNFTANLRKMLKGSMVSWNKIVSTCFGSQCVQITGLPSKKLAREVILHEKERIKHQRDNLGNEGKAKCAEELQKAITKNKKLTLSKDTAAEFLKTLNMSSLSSAKMFDVITYNNLNKMPEPDAGLDKVTKFLSKMPFTTYFHLVPTHIIQVVLFIDSRKLKNQEWLLLLLDQVFNSPAEIGNVEISAEYVEQMMYGELESLEVKPSVINPYIELRLKTTSENWSEMRKLAELYYTGTIFDAKRVSEGLERLRKQGKAAEIDEKKLCESIINFSQIPDEMTPPFNQLCDPIQQTLFHDQIERVSKMNQAWAISQLEELRESLLKADINMHIVCDKEHIPVFEKWEFLKCDKRVEFKAQDLPRIALQTTARVTSQYIKTPILRQVGDCEFKDGDKGVVELMLLLDYVNRIIAQHMKATGLAESAKFTYNKDRKWIELEIYDSYKIQYAYHEVIEIVNRFLEDDAKTIDKDEFDEHRRRFARDLYYEYADLQSAIDHALYADFRSVQNGCIRDLADRAMRIEAEGMMTAAGKQLKTFIANNKLNEEESQNSTLVVVVPEEKTREIDCYFKDSKHFVF